ncbi:MAG: IS1 family transposase [Bacteroidia bacterium]|nr:IS1 family transposase [Bacteroidia bacterium]
MSPERKHTCHYCNHTCIRKGIRNQIQKYYCKRCCKYQQQQYCYRKLDKETMMKVLAQSIDGSGISSIARSVSRSKSTVQRVLELSAKGLTKPDYKECNQEYELDEMSVTIAGKEDTYLIYAINRRTRKVVDFLIGNRTKENIRKVVETVLRYHPKIIFTDGLNSYPSLIPKIIHRPGRRLTNRIERKNLSIRNFIKRLSRNTLCFSRKKEMLEVCLKLSFWG